MNITDAAQYQDSFDALDAQTVTAAQAQEIVDVTEVLRGYLEPREAAARSFLAAVATLSQVNPSLAPVVAQARTTKVLANGNT